VRLDVEAGIGVNASTEMSTESRSETGLYDCVPRPNTGFAFPWPLGGCFGRDSAHGRQSCFCAPTAFRTARQKTSRLQRRLLRELCSQWARQNVQMADVSCNLVRSNALGQMLGTSHLPHPPVEQELVGSAPGCWNIWTAEDRGHYLLFSCGGISIRVGMRCRPGGQCALLCLTLA